MIAAQFSSLCGVQSTALPWNLTDKDCASRRRSSRASAAGRRFPRGHADGAVLDLFHHQHVFLTHKQHSRALVMGCGPTAADVDASAARRLMDHFDVWATNQFFYHHYLVPNFYHAEIKGDALNSHWHRGFLANETKRRLYASTVFIGQYTGATCRKACFGTSYLDILQNATTAPAHLFAYEYPADVRQVDYWHCNKQTGVKAAEEALLGGAPSCDQLSKYCASSMTLVLSLIVSMGYKEVYMLGIDLVQADHFFSVHPAYGAEHRMFSRVSHSSLNQTQELSVLPHNHSGRHLTEGRGFSKFVEGLFEGLRGRGVRGFNLSPLSKPIISTETVPYRRLDALLESIDTESS